MPFINEVVEHNRRQAVRGAEAVPTSARRSRFLFEPEDVMALLRSRIVGQDAVLAQLEGVLRVVKAGIGDAERPLAVNLFLGPTGVGKTEIVRLLALAIHGKPDAFCRIDMHTLAQEHYAAALTGYAAGYLPWFADIDRQMYFFYATPMAPFLIILITLILGDILYPRSTEPERRTLGLLVVCFYVALVITNFAWMYPILTGLPISPATWNLEIVLPSWR